MKKELEDGYIEDLGEGKVRVWNKTGDGGGFWTTMSKHRLEKDFEKDKIPFFCRICRRPMLVDVDRKMYIKYKCCFKCYIFFVEGREKDWSREYAPTEPEMNRYEKWRDKK